MFAAFTTAAKEEMFSAFGPWCAETCISASECEGEKPHQGVAGKNPALHQGIVWCNSTTALGLRGMSLENGVRSRCKGKERDTETANDNFDAREYTWRFGRWLSSDWSATPAPVPYANLSNPQTLNLYAMVSDDPESFADLDGHCGEDACVVETLAGATILVMATQAYFAMPPEQRNFGASLSQAANSVGGAISGLFQSSDNSKTAPQSNPAPGAQSGTQAVQPYDVGEAKDLQGRSVPGDNVDIHHVPQQNPASQTVAGYDGKTAPAMGVPKDEHKTIPTEKGEATRTPRDQLAKDARDLRNKTNASNSQVQKVIDLNKQKYPEMMKKPAKNDND